MRSTLPLPRFDWARAPTCAPSQRVGLPLRGRATPGRLLRSKPGVPTAAAREYRDTTWAYPSPRSPAIGPFPGCSSATDVALGCDARSVAAATRWRQLTATVPAVRCAPLPGQGAVPSRSAVAGAQLPSQPARPRARQPASPPARRLRPSAPCPSGPFGGALAAAMCSPASLRSRLLTGSAPLRSKNDHVPPVPPERRLRRGLKQGTTSYPRCVGAGASGGCCVR